MTDNHQWSFCHFGYFVQYSYRYCTYFELQQGVVTGYPGTTTGTLAS